MTTAWKTHSMCFADDSSFTTLVAASNALRIGNEETFGTPSKISKVFRRATQMRYQCLFRLMRILEQVRKHHVFVNLC